MGAVFGGDWRTIPRHCGGFVQVADMSIACDECGMNTWYLPTPDRVDEVMGIPTGEAYPRGLHLLPDWCPPAIREAIMRPDGNFEYEPYFTLFSMAHPFTFDDCHDPGDEDEEKWPAWGLYMEALLGRNVLVDRKD